MLEAELQALLLDVEHIRERQREIELLLADLRLRLESALRTSSMEECAPLSWLSLAD